MQGVERAKAVGECVEVADSGAPTTGQCKKGKCDTIGSTKVCTDCAFNNEVPINGECKDVTQAPGSTFCTGYAAGLCSACKGASFMFKGGCYQPSEVPGSSLCKAAPAGICTSPASEGYFVPPDADTAHQSVLACNDTDIVTLQNGKKYTGVTSCATCIQPSAAEANTPKAATCTACETTTPTYLKTVDGVTTCVPKSDCNNGFFVEENATPKKCTACNDNANCVACTGSSSNQCTRCKADGTKPYLKKDGETDAGSCVSGQECTTPKTHYIDDTVGPINGTMCKTCVSGGATGCETCMKGDSGAICNTCPGTGNTIFGLSKKSCVSQCPTNSSKQNDTCVCNDGFTPTAGPLRALNAIPAALHAVLKVRVVANPARQTRTSWGRQVDRLASASRVETHLAARGREVLCCWAPRLRGGPKSHE